MHLTKEQRTQVINELTLNPHRLDTEIGELLNLPAVRVGQIRRTKGFPNYSHITRRKFQIQAELQQNPDLTNSALAEKYGCSMISVARYRSEIGIAPAKRGNGTYEVSEGTMKCREMLLAGTTLPDVHIAKACGISFAHVARQRDLLGLQRSGRSNRLPSTKSTFDFTGIDAEIIAKDMSLTRIAEKWSVPVSWVNERSRQIGIRRNGVDQSTMDKIRELLMREDRMTTTQIAEMLNVSASTVNNVRKKVGVKRLPPGLPKYEETKRAQKLLADPNRKSLSAIAKESNLTVATVTKIRNRMMNDGALSKKSK